MKVIFLDIDGVLNNSTLLYHYGTDFIDGDMTELFASVVKITGSEVVLSSSWRLDAASKKIVDEALGVYGVRVMDTTPYMHRMRRCREISRWIRENPGVVNYAIVDDNPDAGVGMEDNFFKTDPELGLDKRIAQEIVNHLGPAS